MNPKQWLETVTLHGCVITGRSDIQRHHCAGRKFKHNKTAIGEYFVLPLWYELHDVSSNHEFNVTHHKRAFTDNYGLQSELFAKMCDKLQDLGHEIPSQEILAAIKDCRI